MQNKLKLGLVCISEQLKLVDKKKHSFQTMTRKRFNDLCNSVGRDKAISSLSKRVLHNILLTKDIVRHCIDSDISHYRLSSSLFPLVTDQTIGLSIDDLTDADSIIKQLKYLGILANKKVSIGSHPDQYNVLASQNQGAVGRTIDELNFQAKVFDLIGLPRDHSAPMNIHINYSPKGSESMGDVAERFCKNLLRCNQGVISRLTVENEDKGFCSVKNALLFNLHLKSKYNICVPVCYDNLHDSCNGGVGAAQMRVNAELCKATWPKGIVPVFHWSEGLPDKPRSHADYVAEGNFPFDMDVVFEVECKAKDMAIAKLKEQMAAAA